jgi:hypothetical protein
MGPRPTGRRLAEEPLVHPLAKRFVAKLPRDPFGRYATARLIAETDIGNLLLLDRDKTAR